MFSERKLISILEQSAEVSYRACAYQSKGAVIAMVLVVACFVCLMTRNIIEVEEYVLLITI
jgi:hypothetical protein